MGDVAIKAENLGKRYQIAHARRGGHDTLREALSDLVRAPFRRRSGAAEGTSEAFWALKDIGFEVRRGEAVGVIGRNGSGKSTLLKILSRITKPTTGRAEIHGRVGSLLEVGTGFHPELTGRENVFLNGAILGMRKAEISRRFDEIVAFAEVEKFIDTPVKHYSSGMYTRLAFAVAAHLEPEILIVDEVLAVGDAAFQRKCLARMQDAANEGQSILFVSHNMAAVAQFCDTAMILMAGSAVDMGPSSDVIAKYLQMQQTSAETLSIGDRPRGHGLKPILSDFRLTSADGQLVHTGCRARIQIVCDSDRMLPNATVGVCFESEQGERVMCVNTRWELGYLALERGRTRLVCEVPDFPLAPGRYHVVLGVSSNGRQTDLVERAAVVDVEFNNYFENGQSPQRGQGSILRRSTWDIDAA